MSKARKTAAAAYGSFIYTVSTTSSAADAIIPSLAELRQAEADLIDVCRRTRRIFGTSHPESATCEELMGQLKATIAARVRNSGDA